MVSEPTVLIVGAGGSMPYGYPSGLQLVDKILEFTLGLHTAHADTADYEGYYGHSLQKVMDFRNSLKVSRRNSIDAFLGAPNHTQLVRLGKLLIAEQLIDYEVRSLDLLLHRKVKDDWYRYLANRLADNMSEKKPERLTILTYNYDRSLEFYVRGALQAAFSFSEDQLEENLMKFKIIHIHGQLSKLPVPVARDVKITNEYLAQYRHYGFRELPNLIPALAEGIKIVHENDPTQGITAEARNALHEASRICFLGFGYNELNLKPLCQSKWCNTGSKIVGSRVGLVSSEIEGARAYLGPNFEYSDIDHECYETLRRFSWILS